MNIYIMLQLVVKVQGTYNTTIRATSKMTRTSKTVTSSTRVKTRLYREVSNNQSIMHKVHKISKDERV